MEQTGNGTISQTDLMTKLAQAKKVMNKVESGNFKTGQVNEQILRSNPEEIDLSSLQQYNQSEQLGEEVTNYGDVSRYNVSKPVNVDKIRNSKLPDAIKNAMIERPITQPDISLSDGIDMKIIQGAKRLMEQENPTRKTQPQTQSLPIELYFPKYM